MAKVELIGEMKDIEGWTKVAKLVKKRLKRWLDLRPWKVLIRAETEEDKKTEMKRTGGKEHLRNFISIDKKKKILIVAFEPVPADWPENKADLIFGILRFTRMTNMSINDII